MKEYKKKWREDNKDKIKKQNEEYFRRIYDECEAGIVENTIIHKVFVYLNHNPDISIQDLFAKFFNENPATIRRDYTRWIELTYNKYIKN